MQAFYLHKAMCCIFEMLSNQNTAMVFDVRPLILDVFVFLILRTINVWQLRKRETRKPKQNWITLFVICVHSDRSDYIELGCDRDGEWEWESKARCSTLIWNICRNEFSFHISVLITNIWTVCRFPDVGCCVKVIEY